MTPLVRRCTSGAALAQRCATGPALLRRCLAADPCVHCAATPVSWAAVLTAGGNSGACRVGCFVDWECFPVALAFSLEQNAGLPCQWEHSFGPEEVLFHKQRGRYVLDCDTTPKPWLYVYLDSVFVNITAASVQATIYRNSAGAVLTETQPNIGCDHEYAFTYPAFCFACSDGPFVSANLTITPVF